MNQKQNSPTAILSLAETAGALEAQQLPSGINLSTAVIAGTKPRDLNAMLPIAHLEGMDAGFNLEEAEQEVGHAKHAHGLTVQSAQEESDRKGQNATFMQRAMTDLGFRFLDEADTTQQQLGSDAASAISSLASDHVGKKADSYGQQALHPSVSDKALEQISDAKTRITATQEGLAVVRATTREPLQIAELARTIESQRDKLGKRARILSRFLGLVAGAAIITGPGYKVTHDMEEPSSNNATGVFATQTVDSPKHEMIKSLPLIGGVVGGIGGFAVGDILAEGAGQRSARRRARRMIRKAKG